MERDPNQYHASFPLIKYRITRRYYFLKYFTHKKSEKDAGKFSQQKFKSCINCLGYPVMNDPLYNHLVFGPDKGKGGLIGKTDDKLITDLISIHNAENWLGMDGDTELSMFNSGKEQEQPLTSVEQSVLSAGIIKEGESCSQEQRLCITNDRKLHRFSFSCCVHKLRALVFEFKMLTLFFISFPKYLCSGSFLLHTMQYS